MSSQGWFCLFKNRQRCLLGGKSRRRIAYFLESHDQMEPSGEYELYPAHIIHYELESSGDSAADSPSMLNSTSMRESSFNSARRPDGVTSSQSELSLSEEFPTNFSQPLSLLASHNENMDSWSDLSTSILYEEEEEAEALPSNPENNSRILVALIAGEDREHLRKAATVLAATVEEMTSMMDVDDDNFPQLQVDCRGLTPRQLVSSVNSLLAPLRPHVYKPRAEDHHPHVPSTSDWETSSSTQSSPPLSPSSSTNQLTTASLSPIPTPLSPPSLNTYRMEPIRTSLPSPHTPAEPRMNVEIRTSTVRTPLQSALDSVHHVLATADNMETSASRETPTPSHQDPDSTMNTA